MEGDGWKEIDESSAGDVTMMMTVAADHGTVDRGERTLLISDR